MTKHCMNLFKERVAENVERGEFNQQRRISPSYFFFVEFNSILAYLEGTPTVFSGACF